MESWTENGPDAIIHCAERRTLLKQVKLAIGCEVTPTAWAVLWLSDLEALRQVVSAVGEPFFLAGVLTRVDLGLIVRQCSSEENPPLSTTWVMADHSIIY